MGQYILALEQDVSESKATLVDKKGKIIATTAYPIKLLQNRSGNLEYNPVDLLESLLNAVRSLFKKIGSRKKEIDGLGLATQPSTVILWDKTTGKPLYNAISFKDPRGVEVCQGISDNRDNIRERTGLILSPMYSSPKIKWLLDNVKSIKRAMERGRLLCGTVNTYIMWHLTKGSLFATDHSNAAKTLLCNIFLRSWDKELTELFGVPNDILPMILPTSCYFGDAVIDKQAIPIHASIVNYQAPLIGKGCVQEGDVDLHYDREGFVFVNTGKKIFILPGLLTTIGWSTNGTTIYLLEGIITSAGSIFNWLENNLGIISRRDRIEELYKSSKERIFFLPALQGVGSPYWDTKTTASLFGLRSTTRREDIVRSAVESIAFEVKDNLNIIERDERLTIRKVVAGGPLSDLSCLLQFQSDLIGIPVLRPKETYTRAIGVAFLAGLSIKNWPSLSSAEKFIGVKKTYKPRLDGSETKRLYERWRLTYLHSREWSKNYS